MTRTHVKTVLTLHALAFLAVLALPVGVFAQETFVPLTSLPGVTELANPGTIVSGDSLPAFFNSLYRLCIGAAAVIAVVQIIRAGIKFMSSSGSISANQEAKALLGNAIFGIILVLSPVIVFGIINPDILRLDLDLGSLKIEGETLEGAGTALWSTNGNRTTETARCTAAGGKTSYHCVNSSGVSRDVPMSEGCKTGETGRVVCMPSDDTISTVQQCKVYDVSTVPSGTGCNLANGYSAIPNGCCSGASPETQCCGRPSSQKILLAYYSTSEETQTNSENGTTTQKTSRCYVPTVETFGNLETCMTRKAAIDKSSADTNRVPKTYQRSCVLGETSYAVVPPTDLPKCARVAEE